MYRVTILFGILLGITGMVGFYLTGAKHLTALIPAFIGIPMFVCGIIAAKEAMRMMAMHIAILIGLIGFIGAVATLFKAEQELAAIVSKSITSVLCATFVGLCVRSFIQARKAREAAAVVEATE
jgi:hypothetical protein